MKKQQIDREELILDACRELGNIGTGSAITILSHMIHENIMETLTEARRMGDGELLLSMGERESSAYGILFPVHGELEGVFACVISEEMKEQIIGAMENETDEVATKEEKQIVLQEVANLMASAYLSSIAAYVDKEIRICRSKVAYDMVASMLTDIASIIVHTGPHSLGITSSFSIGKVKNGCKMLLMLYQETSEELYHVLGLENL